MKIHFLFLLIFCSLSSKAQSFLDSAFRCLYSKEERVVMRTIHYISHVSLLDRIDKNKHDSVRRGINEKLIKEIINNDQFPSFSRVAACLSVGNYYFSQKDLRRGFLYFNKAEKENKGQRNRNLYYLYESNASNYQSWHRLDSALVYAEREIEIAKEIGDDTLVFDASYRLGSILYGIKDYDKSRKYLHFVARHNLKSKDFLRTIYNTIALSYQKQALMEGKKDYFDSARAYYDTAYFYASLYPKDFFWKGLIRGNIGDSYFYEKKYEKAIPYLYEDLKSSLLSQKNRVNENAMITMNRIAAAYTHLGKMDSAKIFKDSLEKNLPKVNLPSLTKEFYEVSALYFQKKGDFTSAFSYLNRYLTFSDSMNKVENINEANKLETQITAEYQRKNTLKELEVQKAENELKNKVFIVVTLVFLLLASLIYALYTVNNDKIKANTLLNLQKADISAKNEELSQINEELKNTLDVVANQNKAITAQSNELSELNQLKDKLFSIISHDLRSPLGAMKGVLTILAMGGLSDEEIQMISKDIKKRLDGLDYTLNNLLVWSKSQMSGSISFKEKIEIQSLINGKINLFIANAEAKNIKLINLVPEHTFVCADLNHLRLVFRNLLSNAIKFTPENGKIEVVSTDNEEFVQIGVRDSGIGMTEEQLQKLFNRNTHFTTRGTKDEKGTGLGLLLCKEFIEKDGGRIWVESRPNQGSTFFVELPKI
ncbi:MAG: hypothetical protein EAZ08_10480 [Cytophagales bacterium]|nr:MAG: hypothetical protein EAZ08_10480 [Cytophagales bacterium]